MKLLISQSKFLNKSIGKMNFLSLFFLNKNFSQIHRNENVADFNLHKEKRVKTTKAEDYFDLELEKSNLRRIKHKPLNISPTKLIFENLSKKPEEEIFDPETKKLLNSKEAIDARFMQHYKMNKSAYNHTINFDYSRLIQAHELVESRNRSDTGRIYRETAMNLVEEENAKIEERNNLLRRTVKTKGEEVKSGMNELLSKLGYLDYRDFLCLNKYLVEKQVNEKIITKAKKNILNVALELVEDSKRKDLKKILDKNGIKNFDKNVQDVFNFQELFNKYYDIIKKAHYEDENNLKSLEEKMEEINNLGSKEFKTFQDYKDMAQNHLSDALMDEKSFGFNSEIDDMIRKYRRARMKPIKQDFNKIVRKVSLIFNIDNYAKKLNSRKHMDEASLEINQKLQFIELEKYAIEERKRLKSQDNENIDLNYDIPLTRRKKYQFRDYSELFKDANLEDQEKQKGGAKKKKEATSTAIDDKPKEITNKSLQRASRSALKRWRKKNQLKLPRRKYTFGMSILFEFRKGGYTLNSNIIDYQRFNKYNITDREKIREMRRKPTRNFEKNLGELDEFVNKDENIEFFKTIEELADYRKKQDILLLMKYLLIVDKFKMKSIYEPTNLEMEKKIYYYLRSKIENQSALDEDRFKAELEKDSFFASIMKEYNEREGEEKSEKLKNDIEKIKKNYILSKNEFESKKLLEKFDRMYAEQFGVNFADEEFNKMFTKNSIYENNGNPISIKINNKNFPVNFKVDSYKHFRKHKVLMKNLVDNYYREYKLNHMYNAMDYYTNKYKIRRRILEASEANKTSLKEVSQLLTRLAHKMVKENEDKPSSQYDFTRRFDMGLYDYKSESGRKSFAKIFEVIEKRVYNIEEKPELEDNLEANQEPKNSFIDKVAFKPVLPKEIEEYFQDNKDVFNNHHRDIVLRKMNTIDDQKVANRFENFEIEAYQSYKNDPFYIHYMHNFLSFQADQKNNFREVMDIQNKVKAQNNNTNLLYATTEETDRLFKLMNDFSTKDMERYYNLSTKIKNNDDSLDNDVSKSGGLDELVVGGGYSNINRHYLEGTNFKYISHASRKKSRCIVVLKNGTGKITVNGKSLVHYFLNPYLRSKAILPLVVTDTLSKVDVVITLYGGGFNGQPECVVLALSKCLVKLDSSYEPILNEHLFLTTDYRRVERKKGGLQKARKGQVYRRR